MTRSQYLESLGFVATGYIFPGVSVTISRYDDLPYEKFVIYTHFERKIVLCFDGSEVTTLTEEGLSKPEVEKFEMCIPDTELIEA